MFDPRILRHENKGIRFTGVRIFLLGGENSNFADGSSGHLAANPLTPFTATRN